MALIGTGRLPNLDLGGWVHAQTKRLFWSTLLAAPHKGIRTLAAQNLVRLDPVRELISLGRLFDSRINEALLAHDLLQRLGAGLLQSIAVQALPDAELERLIEALIAVGQPEAASAIVERRTEGLRSAGDRIDAIMAPLASEQRHSMDGIIADATAPASGLTGLMAANRPRTVERFMVVGGTTVPPGDVRRVAAAKQDLRLPSLQGA